MKKILITGGTGSWGQTIAKKLLDDGDYQVIVFSRSELDQVKMANKFKGDNISFIIGDIRDGEAVLNASVGVDIIIHAAALKHVPICEAQPVEAIKTNIYGTKNVIAAAIKNNVNKVVNISSDKAVEPTSLYGMTKAVGEKLILQANLINENKTHFINVRSGNVIGSNGSVIPLLIDKIKKDNKVLITDPEMTRFFISLDEVIDFVILVAEYGTGGFTYLPEHMPSFYIKDIIQFIVEKYGDDNTIIETIGARKGEKKHELLITQSEGHNIFMYKYSPIQLLGINECGIPDLAVASMYRVAEGYSNISSQFSPETPEYLWAYFSEALEKLGLG